MRTYMMRQSSFSPENTAPAPAAKLVLGIEGGGTKTEWVLLRWPEGAAEGTVERSGRLPAANLKLIADDNLAQLLGVLPREGVSHVGVYLAGCATPADHARLEALVRRAWPDAVRSIGNDRDSALATAFREGNGIAVIAGTGAAVHGRCGPRIEKAGGWGQLLGDRGSGYHLAMQGLRAVLSHYDLTHTITPMAQGILQALGLNHLQDLVDWAMGADKMSVARLAPAIFEGARRGEPEMLAIVQGGAQLLAEFTHSVAHRLDFPAPQVRLVGGLFVYHAEYTALYRYRLSTLLPHAAVEVCAESGALGAAWLASQREGALPPPAVALGGVAGISTKELAAASTEQRNPRSATLDQLSTPALVDLFISEEAEVGAALAACREELTDAVDLVGGAMLAGGRLFYLGAGTSGRLGVLDASEIPPTFGAAPELVQGIIAGGAVALHRAVERAEDQPEAGALAVQERGVRAGDVVCGIAASGRTPFVLGGLAQARTLGAHTLLLTANPARHRLEPRWNVEIDLPTGPEIVTGSTRLKAGTATKLVLNLLSTSAMVRLGKVRGNLMVDVQVTNDKLRDRGVRLVSTILEVPYEEAHRRLEQAQWSVRACLNA